MQLMKSSQSCRSCREKGRGQSTFRPFQKVPNALTWSAGASEVLPAKLAFPICAIPLRFLPPYLSCRHKFPSAIPFLPPHVSSPASVPPIHQLGSMSTPEKPGIRTCCDTKACLQCGSCHLSDENLGTTGSLPQHRAKETEAELLEN